MAKSEDINQLEFAMIAFNASRRHPSSIRAGGAALLNGESGAWWLGVPAIARQSDPLTLGATQAYQISPLRVEF